MEYKCVHTYIRVLKKNPYCHQSFTHLLIAKMINYTEPQLSSISIRLYAKNGEFAPVCSCQIFPVPVKLICMLCRGCHRARLLVRLRRL